MNRAVFLDRDGTLNEDVGYPRSFEDIIIFPESFEAIRLLNRAGFFIIVVTNQSAVGRGWLSESELQKIHIQMKEVFLVQGARIDAFYYCPHWFPSANQAYGLSCECRKPGIALGQKAAQEFHLNLRESFMVGDKIEDILFGHRLGAKSVLVLTGEGQQTWQSLNWIKEKVKLAYPQKKTDSSRGEKQTGWAQDESLNDKINKWTNLTAKLEELEPDFVAKNILEAAHWIIENSNLASPFK